MLLQGAAYQTGGGEGMTRDELLEALACCVHEEGKGCADCPLKGEPCCENRLMKLCMKELLTKEGKDHDEL